MKFLGILAFLVFCYVMSLIIKNVLNKSTEDEYKEKAEVADGVLEQYKTLLEEADDSATEELNRAKKVYQAREDIHEKLKQLNKLNDNFDELKEEG